MILTDLSPSHMLGVEMAQTSSQLFLSLVLSFTLTMATWRSG